MDKIKLLLFISTIFTACGGWLGDYTEDLGNDYIFIGEGPTANEIIKQNSTIDLSIPPDVLSYKFNDNYIIVKQKPNEIDNIVKEQTISYSKGRNHYYFWIIDKSNDNIIGPLDSCLYLKYKQRLKIEMNF